MNYRSQWPTFILRSNVRSYWLIIPKYDWSVRVAERLALPTSDHGVMGSNPAGSEVLPEPKQHFIAQSLSCSPFHRLEMTEILLKGRKTLTHPSIQSMIFIHQISLQDIRQNNLTMKYRSQCLDKYFEVKHQVILNHNPVVWCSYIK